MNAFARLRCGGLPFRAALLCPRFEGVRRVDFDLDGSGRRRLALDAPIVAGRDMRLPPVIAPVHILGFAARSAAAFVSLVSCSCAVLCHAAKSSAYFTRPQAAQGVGGF
jgi:hypothetical protein